MDFFETRLTTNNRKRSRNSFYGQFRFSSKKTMRLQIVLLGKVNKRCIQAEPLGKLTKKFLKPLWLVQRRTSQNLTTRFPNSYGMVHKRQ